MIKRETSALIRLLPLYNKSAAVKSATLIGRPSASKWTPMSTSLIGPGRIGSGPTAGKVECETAYRARVYSRPARIGSRSDLDSPDGPPASGSQRSSAFKTARQRAPHPGVDGALTPTRKPIHNPPQDNLPRMAASRKLCRRFQPRRRGRRPAMAENAGGVADLHRTIIGVAAWELLLYGPVPPHSLFHPKRSAVVRRPSEGS
jgi:hypothetical protein